MTTKHTYLFFAIALIFAVSLSFAGISAIYTGVGSSIKPMQDLQRCSYSNCYIPAPKKTFWW